MSIKNTTNYYWNESELIEHIKEYQNTTDCVQRNLIYETHIHTPLLKLCENCAHMKKFSYALNVYGDEDLKTILISHASTLLDKIDCSKGKAFTFLTICLKRYAINLNSVAYKEFCKNESIQEMGEDMDGQPTKSEDTIEFLKTEDSYHKVFDYKEFISFAANYIKINKKIICGDNKLTSIRHKNVIEEILNLMMNLNSYDGGLNKKSILNNIRSRTGLKTQRCTSILTKLRHILTILKTIYISRGAIPESEFTPQERSSLFRLCSKPALSCQRESQIRLKNKERAEIFTLVNIDSGKTISGTKYYISNTTGMSYSSINELVNSDKIGHSNTRCGWRRV